MPVKVWDRMSDGTLTSRIETSRSNSYRGERYRADAEALDREIDRMLDHAVALSASVPVRKPGSSPFVKRWAIGRALVESNLSESEYLEADEHKSLWLAIARKCRLGVRSSGNLEDSWRGLISHRDFDPLRTERDVFAMGRWLQEQEIAPAMAAFGAKLANAHILHYRSAINAKKLRNALAQWFEGLHPARRTALTEKKNFVLLAKALAERFPARGPGSAKRPVHYSEEELYEEMRKTLDPVAAGLVPESKTILEA